MIKIQRLKEPKKGKSGEEILPGKKLTFKGVEIKNLTKHTLYCSWYMRPGSDYIDRKGNSKKATLEREKQNGKTSQ